MQLIENAIREINGLEVTSRIGRVVAADGGKIIVSGLEGSARLGQQAKIEVPDREHMSGDVVQIGGNQVTIMPDGSLTGLQVGAVVTLHDEAGLAPCDQWLGRVIDPNGQPLDGAPLPTGPHTRPLRAPAPRAASRKGFGPRMSTGSFALNTMLPLVQGQRLGLFAGSGVGKSSLLGLLAQNVAADVVVVALIGERGRELRAFTHDTLGEEGMKKCVVVAATSDRSALERRRCLWSAMTTAEHFREQGKSVLFLADSITRFAEAHREVATFSGEIPVLRGHPPSTAQMITELCERAGPGPQGSGDITAVLTVLVQGSDFDEPVSDILRGVLDGHIVLDRAIAERGRYPAINLLKSVSRSLPGAASDLENQTISQVRQLISIYEENALMVRSGLYSEGSDPELDKAVKVWPELDSFLGLCGPLTPEQCFDRLRLVLRRAGIT